jgi:putative PIN family toxin of toxin-antitoxin system
MRAVLDTNVLVSATLIKGGTEDKILRVLQHGKFELVLSAPILEEIGRAILYEKLQKCRWMTKEELTSLIQLLAQESILVSGTTHVRVCRDPDDDKFLAAAIEGKAQWVVSGDKDLLELKTYKGVSIVKPARFLKELEGNKKLTRLALVFR